MRKFIWDPTKVGLYIHEYQALGSVMAIGGFSLCVDMQQRGVVPYNANLIDFLIDHPDQAPEAFKTPDANGEMPHVMCWGTIYGPPADSDKEDEEDRYVRLIRFEDGHFTHRYWCFTGGWPMKTLDSRAPAAVLSN